VSKNVKNVYQFISDTLTEFMVCFRIHVLFKSLLKYICYMLFIELSIYIGSYISIIFYL